MPTTHQDLLQFINETPEAQSLLYDMDLMPDQNPEKSEEWNTMMNIALHMYLYGKRMAESFDQGVK